MAAGHGPPSRGAIALPAGPKLLALLAVAFGAGALAARFLWPAPEHLRSSEDRLSRGSLTRPLLECEVPDYPEKGVRPLDFRLELRDFVHEVEARAGVRRIAVYFRDLNNGPWIGIREKERFTTASLYKVPLLVAALKRGGEDPEFWRTGAVFPGMPSPDLRHYRFRPERELEVGREYAVPDLVERTVLYSDNAAAWLLGEILGQEAIDTVLRDLGIDPGELRGGSSSLSAVEFGRFLRVLYNASYLPQPTSEAALELLSRTTFRKGLVAGLPVGTKVAHKFGEKMHERGGVRTIQLHDCGIVYQPQRPYLLCVMTLGTDYEAQADAIRDITRFTNDQVSLRAGAP